MFSPFGTSGRYFEIGSSRASLPSSTSCRMTVDVIVLVLLPMRKWSSIDIGTSLPSSAVPNVADHSPWSFDLMRITTPGMALAAMTFGISSCSTFAYAGRPPVDVDVGASVVAAPARVVVVAAAVVVDPPVVVVVAAPVDAAAAVVVDAASSLSSPHAASTSEAAIASPAARNIVDLVTLHSLVCSPLQGDVRVFHAGGHPREPLRCDGARSAAGYASGWSPTTLTKLTHAPGPPPRLWVSALRLAAAIDAIWRAPASPRSCSQHSNSIRRPDAPIGWPNDFRPPSGLTGQLAVEVERAGEHFLPAPCRARRTRGPPSAPARSA